MTSKERIYTAFKLKVPDRVPLLPNSRVWAMRYLGYTFEECVKDPGKFVEAQLSMLEDFNVDAVFDFGVFYPIERVLGQNILTHEDDFPAAIQPLINAPEDFAKLPKNVPLKGKRWVDYQISIVKRLKQRVGEDVPLLAFVSSPFLSACYLRGTDNLFLDLYKNPDFVKALVKYLIEPTLEYTELQAAAGADIIHMACPVASRNMISREHYEEFVHPVHKQIFTYWKKRLNRKIFFHVCGDWSDRFDLVVDEGPDVIHVDEIDLAVFKREFGNKVCINGNVRTATTLLLGSPEKVKREAIECINKGGLGGGFMLGANCVVPRDTPTENMRALTEAILEAGDYPITI
jgi:MtaA/CmuA family methyltransferase